MASIKLSLLFAVIVLAVILMADFIEAGPVGHPEKENIAEFTEEKPASSLALKKLTRSKRNAVAYYKHLPEFWAWYKYYMETHNQEGIESLDQLYMIYLQHKNQLKWNNSYKHYLTHLSEIYMACAKSDDPDCIPQYTTEVSHPAPVSVKSPSYIMSPSPLKTLSGYHFYTPALEPFISSEQRAELLRICSPSDTECLQYHLRAAYGYRPALTQVPSYAYLGCDPYKDPYCSPTGMQYVYPHCNPYVDPLCVSYTAQATRSAEEAPKEEYCNPLFEKGCNPLTANRLFPLKAPVMQYVPQDEQNPLHLADIMKPFLISQQAKSHVSGAVPECHPYDPTCNKFSPLASSEASKNEQDSIILPHPDCDPEIDYNCRLRRAKPKDNQNTDVKTKNEPESGDDARNDNVTSKYQVPQFEDFLRGYLGQYKK